jgi:hypothetical protein
MEGNWIALIGLALTTVATIGGTIVQLTWTVGEQATATEKLGVKVDSNSQRLSRIEDWLDDRRAQ